MSLQKDEDAGNCAPADNYLTLLNSSAMRAIDECEEDSCSCDLFLLGPQSRDAEVPVADPPKESAPTGIETEGSANALEVDMTVLLGPLLQLRAKQHYSNRRSPLQLLRQHFTERVARSGKFSRLIKYSSISTVIKWIFRRRRIHELDFFRKKQTVLFLLRTECFRVVHYNLLQ